MIIKTLPSKTTQSINHVGQLQLSNFVLKQNVCGLNFKFTTLLPRIC